MYLELSDPTVKSDNFTYDKCSTPSRNLLHNLLSPHAMSSDHCICCEILQLPLGKVEGIPHQTLNPTTLVLASTLQTNMPVSSVYALAHFPPSRP